MMDAGRPAWSHRTRALMLVGVGLLPGCAVVPSSRLEESRQLAQSLRTENARLKDQVLALQAQNRDYADRALDDLRRLTARDEAIARLERSVQAYQDDRDRLEGAYRRLTMSLGRPAGDDHAEPAADRPRSPSAPGTTVRADLRGEGRTEGLSGQADGGTVGPRPRSSADGSGP
jgi:hypothetical protein